MEIPVTICFFGIFRGEVETIVRCLDSVLPVVDFVHVTDTRSSTESDAMEKVVIAWGEKHSIPTRVEVAEFVDFGTSRTDSLERARLAFDARYYLTLDADMCLVVEETFDKQKLCDPVYSLVQQTATLRYSNTRLFRADVLPIRCIGSTHEYWDAYPVTRLSTLWIDDRGDGAYKAKKFVRDIQLLTKDLYSGEGNKYRSVFYLAESYKNHAGSLKDPEERDATLKIALQFYRMSYRSSTAWIHEKYTALTASARIQIQRKKREKVIALLTEAWTLCPTSPDAPYELANYLVFDGNTGDDDRVRAFNICIRARDSTNDSDGLFRNRVPLWYGFDYLISISAYYAKKFDQGRLAIEKVLSDETVPEWVTKACESNRRFYQ